MEGNWHKCQQIYTHARFIYSNVQRKTKRTHNNINQIEWNQWIYPFLPFLFSYSCWTVNCMDSLFFRLHIHTNFVHSICRVAGANKIRLQLPHQAHTFAIRMHTHVQQREWYERSTKHQGRRRKKKTKKKWEEKTLRKPWEFLQNIKCTPYSFKYSFFHRSQIFWFFCINRWAVGIMMDMDNFYFFSFSFEIFSLHNTAHGWTNAIRYKIA